MSFSFSAAGTPHEVVARVGHEAANTQNFPASFANAINEQLMAVPHDAAVKLTVSGHSGWAAAQTAGEISLSMTLAVRTKKAPPEPVTDAE